MSVIKALLFASTILLAQLAWSDEKLDYDVLIAALEADYEQAYAQLNAKIEACSDAKNTPQDFAALARQIPKDISRKQLNAALFLLKKRYHDECASPAVGVYVVKAQDIKRLNARVLENNIQLQAADKLQAMLAKVDETEQTLFHVPEAYFEVVADYYTLSKDAREKLESIEGLRSNYNLVKLLDAYQNL